MGDRSNIAISFGEGKKVYLYSHWDGKSIALHLRDLLKKGRRIDDPQYFTRMLFDKMVGKSQGSETGYGISPDLHDNERAVLVLDGKERIVFQEGNEKRRWTVEEFCALTDEECLESMA